mmetsp:Transcript_48561/g.113710  ORF Transcript_48561/g.113710 Transcript_48561/m.113710 type:complete len:347 (-) Transcript_48561:36-1076(-)
MVKWAQDWQSCSECQKGHGRWSGSNQYAGYVYCDQCWLHYFRLNPEGHGRICSECGARPAIVVDKHTSEGAYCETCWSSWLESTDGSVGADSSVDNELHSSSDGSDGGGHFDFIEVGTSNWGTLLQFCANSSYYPSSVGYKMQRFTQKGHAQMQYARGLAVEMVSELLEALPTLPNVTKVHAGMDEKDGEAAYFCVAADKMHLLEDKYYKGSGGQSRNVMWYAVSLGCLGEPHPELLPMLEAHSCSHLLEERSIRVLSWGELCNSYGVSSVDVVQLDCEGKDCAILRGLVAHCEHHPAAWPRVIHFEANGLTSGEEIESTLDTLQLKGNYEIVWRSHQNCELTRMS